MSRSRGRCHGAWREAEVVRDELIAAFDTKGARFLEDLKQKDILILTDYRALTVSLNITNSRKIE